MRPLAGIMLVARRELVERVRSPIFVASLAIMLLVIAAVILVPTLFADRAHTVAVVDPHPDLQPQLAAEAALANLTVETRAYPEAAEAEAALAAGEVDVVVSDREVVWEAAPDLALEPAVTSAMTTVALQERAAELGLEPETVAALLAPPDVTARSLEAVDPDIDNRRLVAFAAMIVLFMAIAMYGSFVLTGVVEEKSSRVVEVLLARIAPRHLLAGKILGIGALGLAQVTLMAVVAAVGLSISGGRGLDLPPVSPGLLAWVVVWFVLGYAFYSTAYGALGALASRSEDAQNAAGPITIVLMASYFIVFTTMIGGPEWTARLVTLLPVTAPMAVPMRTAAGELPWWEAVAALVIMIAVTYGMLRFAGRVYTGAVLRTGAKVRLRDAWRGAET